MTIVSSYDAHTAVSYIAYDLSEKCIVFNETRKNLVSEWASNSNTRTVVVCPSSQLGLGLGHTMHIQPQLETLLSTTRSASTPPQTPPPSSLAIFMDDDFVALVSLLPGLQRALAARLPWVVHVAAAQQSLAHDSPAVRVHSAGGTGALVLASGSVQGSGDMALVAHCLALQARLPVVHLYNPDCSGFEKIHAAPTHRLEALAAKYSSKHSSNRIGESSTLTTTTSPTTTTSTSDNLLLRPSPAAGIDYPAIAESAYGILSDLKMMNLVSSTTDFFSYTGSPYATDVLVILASTGPPTQVEKTVESLVNDEGKQVGVVRVRLYRPWLDRSFLQAVPKSAVRLAVASGGHSPDTGALFSDIVAAFHSHSGTWNSFSSSTGGDSIGLQIREAKVLSSSPGLDAHVVHSIFQRLHSSPPSAGPIIIDDYSNINEQHQYNLAEKSTSAKLQSHIDDEIEGPYIRVLESIFKDRLDITNVVHAPGADVSVKKVGGVETNAEFGFGAQLIQFQQRERLVETVAEYIKLSSSARSAPTSTLIDALKAWHLHQNDASKSSSTHDKIIPLLDAELKKNTAPQQNSYSTSSSSSSSLLRDIYMHRALLRKPSYWLFGGDDISHDLGNSALHQILTSKRKVNLLIIDTQPYSYKIAGGGHQDIRKKDLGLYAMNYGGVYVASVAVHYSYAQVLRALTEADAYPGPSVVLAYAPKITTSNHKSSPTHVNSALDHLAALKETKMAIDAGYWPLYRWDPSIEASTQQSPFSLDSETLKKDLKDFLGRENQLALLLKQHPDISPILASTAETELAAAVQHKVHSAYSKMMGDLVTRPILVLYGSDGGNAEKLAKRLSNEAKSRGLRPKCMSMDSFGGIEELAGGEEEHTVVFVLSTAGQGEFPTNSKEFWKSMSNVSAIDVSKVKFAVFGLGDSHYWPLPEDAHYFAKSGRDLDTKLASLNAARLTPYGIGDDQHPDGYMTGYNAWLPVLWKALGVDEVEVTGSGAVVGLPPDDAIKESSNFLRGTILQGLADTSTGALSDLDGKLTKFHGIYQQDDRDLRDERIKLGFEHAFSFMIRVRVPGGVSTAQQWLDMDTISDQYANGTLKLTTRQAFQFHGVLKRNLKKSIQEINRALMDTIAACGDVNRNVMCNPNPFQSELHQEVFAFSKALSDHLTPRTTAYHEIWLDKKVVASTETIEEEPLYGRTYLPRKFKVAVAIPPSNDVDVFAHDLGYIAISEKNARGEDKLVGFNVSVGGGMGMTHGNKKTFPRLADVMCFCTPQQAVEVGEKVMLVQRDFGDRTNRKHARLKYTIEDRGIDWFRNEVEKLCSFKLQPPRSFKFTSNGDRFGWIKGLGDMWHFGMFIQNGRVKDTPEYPLKTALREIAKIHKGDFRLTPNQSVIIGNVSPTQRPLITALLKKYDIDNSRYSGLMLNSMACVALPTCALAMAESERYLPSLVDKISGMLEESGLRDDAITIRMTGCPNGCARPQIAEIAFIGKAPGAYNMYLGGGFTGERLNKLYKESISEEEILKEIAPMIKQYALERRREEKFGDFVIRKGYIKATTAGNNFHD